MTTCGYGWGEGFYCRYGGESSARGIYKGPGWTWPWEEGEGERKRRERRAEWIRQEKSLGSKEQPRTKRSRASQPRAEDQESVQNGGGCIGKRSWGKGIKAQPLVWGRLGKGAGWEVLGGAMGAQWDLSWLSLIPDRVSTQWFWGSKSVLLASCLIFFSLSCILCLLFLMFCHMICDTGTDFQYSSDILFISLSSLKNLGLIHVYSEQARQGEHIPPSCNLVPEECACEPASRQGAWILLFLNPQCRKVAKFCTR